MEFIFAALYQVVIFPIAVLICKVLPKSPFRSYLENPPASSSEWIKAINYFCPIDKFILITSTWLAAMMLWYIVRWIINLVHNGSFTDMLEVLSGAGKGKPS